MHKATLKYQLQTHPVILIIAVVYGGLLVWFVPGYFTWSAHLVFGLLLIPYLCTANTGKHSLRYLLPALVSCTLAVLMPVNTLFFMAMLFSGLLFVECSAGRISNIVMFLLLLISPVFGHLTRLWEFPMRLWLTEKVAQAANLAGKPAIAAGNQVLMNGYEFSIDPGCAGLVMLVMSLLLCLFVLAWHQKQTSRTLSNRWLAALILITLALNVISNFFRILFIVLFKIMPGTFFHDAVGIICLCLYVLLPLIYMIQPILVRFGNGRSDGDQPFASRPVLRFPLLHAGLLTLVVVIAVRVTNADDFVHPPAKITLAGYQCSLVKGGTLKYRNNNTLIYIKPTAFYAPEHDPVICWSGSGYTFTNIRKQQIKGRDVYMATLRKDKATLYASWWFDDGQIKTVDQLRWRWASLHDNTRFYLVNVNAATAELLIAKTQKLLDQNLFK